MTSLKSIEDFLGLQRFAMIGVSRNPKGSTRSLFREFRARGYDVIPVNPNLWEADGVACVGSIRDVSPPVEGALLLTPPAVTEQVVKDCAGAGVRTIWMYRGTGTGAVSGAGIEFCREHGIDVIEGECPYMFLPDTAWPHRVHRFCRKLTGALPR